MGRRVDPWDPARVIAEVEAARLNADICGLLDEVLKAEGISKPQLANRMGVNHGYVYGLIGLNRRVSLRTACMFFAAAGYRLKIVAEPISPDPTSSAEPSSLPPETASPSPSAEGQAES